MLDIIHNELLQFAVPAEKRKAVFFKTGPGEYAEHDRFLGVPAPRLRQIAKKYRDISLESISELLQSPVNEERFLALMMLVDRYQKGNLLIQEEVFQLYFLYMRHINNWNLVDASAHYIVGAHLFERDKNPLLELASSQIMWERRIAIVSTWYFIHKNEFEWTIKIAEILVSDKHDLIHKAVGWMLREMGKRDLKYLLDFLNQHATQMPRTMLRYSIEKLSIESRKDYLAR
jgi:3-methyladenine DNA glycosylase AlkD